MGVFVKGMYLPPNCYFCPMTNDGFYLCKANNPHKQLEDDCEERRPNWCPLIEVPEPHGRLGDLDAPISLIDTRGEKVEVTVAHIIEKNQGIVKAIIPDSEKT